MKLLPLILLALTLTACPKGKAPPLRQWYPIDRCHDYAEALPGVSNPRPKCLGCVGTKCDVASQRSWSDAIDIHKLDCSAKVCISR